MSNNNFSKKSLIEAGLSVAQHLNENFTLQTEAYQDKIKRGVKTKADELAYTKAETKMKWFNAHVAPMFNESDKRSTALYYTAKNSGMLPELFISEIVTSSYATEKFAFLMGCIVDRKYGYTLDNQSGSRVSTMLELLTDGVEVFTNKHVFQLMNEAKAEAREAAGLEPKPDSGYTQTSQTIKLFCKIGLCEFIKGSGTAATGTAQYRFIDNDLKAYLLNAFHAE